MEGTYQQSTVIHMSENEMKPVFCETKIVIINMSSYEHPVL